MKTIGNILNFAIVGAPKCGTTSLFASLSERSDISFLGKDSHLLGQDLELLKRDPAVNYKGIIDQFRNNQLIGDASVWYLYSKTAAQEIHELNPDCKIIICLRNPMELIPSLHNQHLKGGDESEIDLNKALNADHRNERIPRGVQFKYRPKYIDTVDFEQQIRRYTELFKQVLFVFHEDMKADFKDTVQRIEAFLGLDQRERINAIQSNKRQHIKHPDLLKTIKKKPILLKGVFRTLVPNKNWRHKIMTRAETAALTDSNINENQLISEENMEVVTALIQKQLPHLKELTGRDCSNWLKVME
ncbi:MAG: hypothetical protein HOK65_10530 [Crocinitomicaceae bacterium]|nr:hypothetical protein [Crocinitomicaceae bacterium]